jgi:hypothetical protein
MFKTIDTVPAHTLEQGDVFDSDTDGIVTVVSVDDQGDNLVVEAIDGMDDSVSFTLSPIRDIPLLQEVDDDE